MDSKIRNFINLFSEDDKVVYNALVEKKDLILDSFYSVYSFDSVIENEKPIYKELFSLLNEALYLLEYKAKNAKEKAKFADYRVRYFSKQKKLSKMNTFLVKMNFRKMDDKSYKELFANFYPCLTKDEIIDFKNETMNVLATMMTGKKNDFALIISRHNLLNDSYPLNVFEEICYDPKLITEEQLITLKEVAASLQIPLKEID